MDPDEHYACAATTDELNITVAEIAEGTKRYSLLVKVYECTSSGLVVAQVQSSNHFGIVETRFLQKTDASHAAHVSSYHSNSKNAYWKSYTSAIQGCAV